MIQRRVQKRGTVGSKTQLAAHDASTSNLQPLTFTRSPILRVGIGTDVHRLVAGRKLILGGVQIRFEKGPLGHSDGDALAHALCDALLGASALGDIGRHFPDTSPRWHNASSLLLLRHVRSLLSKAGFSIVNVDATIEIERPKLRPFIPRMARKLAAALGIRPTQVSVKAKTGEGVDAVGLGLAVRAEAIVLIKGSL